MGNRLLREKQLILALVIGLSISISLDHVPRASGQLVGVVCIAPQGTSTSGCPASPQHFPAQGIGSRLIVAINIQGSDALNGFRIFVKTDNTVLNPINADLNNSLLLQPVLVLANCVNGAGTGCSLSGGDGPGVVDVAVTSLGGLTLPPTTGGLFEITYNVLSTSFTTIGFTVAGTCSNGSSVPGQCITITNGGATPDPEMVQSSCCSYAGDPLPISAPSSITAPIGVLTTFTVTAADTDTNPLTLSATGLPTGASFTTSGSNPVIGTVSYTPANGPVSASAVFTVIDTVDHQTASATTSITVPAPDVRFFGGKLSWTHHLSLAKNAGMQTWTAKVTNPGLETAYAVVMIFGTNGVTSFLTTSFILTLISGAAIDATIAQTFGSADVGTKFHFTATIMWGTSPTALNNPGANTKSGAFAVVT